MADVMLSPASALVTPARAPSKMEGARAWFASLAKARKQVDEGIHPGVSASLDFSWRDAKVQSHNHAIGDHDSAAAFIRKEKRVVSPDTKKAESGPQTLHTDSASPDLEERMAAGIATIQARTATAAHQHAAELLPTAVKLSDDQVKDAPSQSAMIHGWHQVIDTIGRPYYVNHDTKQWSWKDPALEVLGTPVCLPQAGASAASPEKGARAAYPEKAPTVVKLQTVQTPEAIAQVDTLGGPLPRCAGKPPPKSPHRQGQPSSPGPRPRVSFSKNVEEQVPGTPPKQPLTGSVSPLVRPALHVRPPSLGELPEEKSKVNARKEDPARSVPLGADGPPTDRQLVRMNDPPVIFQVALVLSVSADFSYISLPRILLPLLIPHLCTSIFFSLMPTELGCLIFCFDSCESLPV
jgi:hypothetical protein